MGKKNKAPHYLSRTAVYVSLLTLGVSHLLAGSARAQDVPQNRYIVFFTDKVATPFSLDQPEAFLSEASLERREQQNIALDSTDLPVDPRYVGELAAAGAEVYYTSRWLNAAMVAGPPEDSSAYQQLAFVSRVELIKPTRAGSRKKRGSSYDEAVPTPARIAEGKEQLLNTEQNEMLGIDEMHQAGYTGKGIAVAVFDGGFKGVDTVSFFRHLYENNQMIPGYDFVGNSPNVYRYGQHGTEALSCIAAYQPGVLEAGAYDAQVMLCVTEESSSEYRVEEYNWLFAAERADSVGIDLISTSLGYTTFDDPAMNYAYEDLDGNTAVITRAVNMATSKGMLCVISAGNEGSGRWRHVSPPADAANALSVGAVSASGDRVSFSSVGPTADERIKPDVSALGLQTVVVDASGNVTRSNGTSFSAPLISGLTAGVWEAFPDATNLEVMEKIRGAGHLALTPNNELGYGIPNFSATIDPILATTEEPRASSHYQVFPNPIENGSLSIKPHAPASPGAVDVYVYSSTGQLVIQEHFLSSTDPTLTLDTSSLGQGIYILHILSPTLSDTVKVVKF